MYSETLSDAKSRFLSDKTIFFLPQEFSPRHENFYLAVENSSWSRRKLLVARKKMFCHKKLLVPEIISVEVPIS